MDANSSTKRRIPALLREGKAFTARSRSEAIVDFVVNRLLDELSAGVNHHKICPAGMSTLKTASRVVAPGTQTYFERVERDVSSCEREVRSKRGLIDTLLRHGFAGEKCLA